MAVAQAAPAPEPLGQPVTVLRAARSAQLVFLLIWIVPAGLVAAGALRQPGAPVWGTLAIAALYGAVLLAWITRFELRFGGGEVVYRTLFAGRRTMPVAAIASVRRETGITRYTDRFLPPLRLELVPRPGMGFRKLVINVKVFEREGIAALERYLAVEKNVLF